MDLVREEAEQALRTDQSDAELFTLATTLIASGALEELT